MGASSRTHEGSGRADTFELSPQLGICAGGAAGIASVGPPTCSELFALLGRQINEAWTHVIEHAFSSSK